MKRVRALAQRFDEREEIPRLVPRPKPAPAAEVRAGGWCVKHTDFWAKVREDKAGAYSFRSPRGRVWVKTERKP